MQVIKTVEDRRKLLFPMRAIPYHHEQNSHSEESPRVVLPVLFRESIPLSILDVGCGRGTWMRAAVACGVRDVVGIDGVANVADDLQLPMLKFRQVDLAEEWDLGRQFDMLVCLEVAEHIAVEHAALFVRMLVRHSSCILFSAASPGQPGEHHLNCKWPEYWQGMLNEHGYVCSDEIRWSVWSDARVEPWYRQNMFVARRCPELAGREERIARVIHPDAWWWRSRDDVLKLVELGSMPATWYLKSFVRAGMCKIRRRLGAARLSRASEAEG